MCVPAALSRVFVWQLLIIYFFSSYIACKCIHDQVTPKIIVTEQTFLEEKVKRHKDPKLFESLNIHAHFGDIYPQLSSSVLYNFEVAIKDVTKLISKLLKVRKVSKPFLLPRESCVGKFTDGYSKDKCSYLRKGPEICSATDVHFEIPDAYLGGVELFDTDGILKHKIDPGVGVPDTNFLLFVISRSTSWCMDKDVQAYGTYCRLNKLNQPVAGLLNLCPEYFSDKLFKSEHYFNVILHEVFHILGFSQNLFPKFKPCPPGIFCGDLPKNIIQEDKKGIFRLLYPEVIKNTQRHFGCLNNDFGAPMQKIANGENNLSSFSSHWHPLLMYSSIMTPAFTEHDYIIIDNITLALFGSTGWYLVNYSYAENFYFGKGEGCDFGFEEPCEKSKYLCLPSKNVTSCDIAYHTIGRCQSIVPDLPCGVYKSNSVEDCALTEGLVFSMDFHSQQYQQRCVMVQKGNSTLEPTCLILKCVSSKTFEVLINAMWVPCWFYEQVKVEDNITIHCPQDVAICLKMGESGRATRCELGKHFLVSMRMYFKTPKFSDLIDNNNFRNFKVTVIQAIARVLDIPYNYIINATLTVFKLIYLDFTICPPQDIQDETLNSLVLRMQAFLSENTFTDILGGATETVIVSTNIAIDPEDVIRFSDHEGFNSLSAFPIIMGIFLIASAVASLIRYYYRQRHKPQRNLEEGESRVVSTTDV